VISGYVDSGLFFQAKLLLQQYAILLDLTSGRCWSLKPVGRDGKKIMERFVGVSCLM
jgi:hypothetical protein